MIELCRALGFTISASPDARNWSMRTGRPPTGRGRQIPRRNRQNRVNHWARKLLARPGTHPISILAASGRSRSSPRGPYGRKRELFSLEPLLISGREVLPIVEGGKGVSVLSNGYSAGAFAAAGGRRHHLCRERQLEYGRERQCRARWSIAWQNARRERHRRNWSPMNGIKAGHSSRREDGAHEISGRPTAASISTYCGRWVARS